MIRGIRAIAVAAIVLGPLTAFAQASPAPPFDPSAFGQYLIRGHEVAVGRLAVALSSGTLATKRGATILALPDSEYTRWWLTTSAAEIRDRAETDSFDDVELPARLRRFARYTSTDADGNFELDKLPRGRYILRGRLSVAFPRAVVPQATANPYAAYGYDSAPVRNLVVFDYSIVWLDSQSIRVGSGPPPDIAFHLVARRDRLDPHRS
ncbi:MAG: hypothetical protein IAI50_20615 [Candidatus Eremiobacteraeota bacterium]|nr:hypothetical protein [Candidatus Eremiobacteraeota bacterium]